MRLPMLFFPLFSLRTKHRRRRLMRKRGEREEIRKVIDTNRNGDEGRGQRSAKEGSGKQNTG